MSMPEKPQEIKESIHENGIKETLKNIKNGEELNKTGEGEDEEEERIDIDELSGEDLQAAIDYLDAIGKDTNRSEIEKAAHYLQNVDDKDELFSAFETGDERGRVDKSIVAPQNMEEETDWHTRDGDFYQILTATSLPRLVSPGWLVPITLSEHDVRLSMHIKPRDTKSVKGRLQQRLTQMKSAIQWKKKRGRTDVYEEKHERQELERLLRNLISGTTKIFNFSFYMEIHGETLEEMEESSRSVQRKVSEQGMDLFPIEGRQIESQKSITPVGSDPIKNNNAVQLEAMATFFNFIEPPVNQSTGVLLGFDDSKRPVIVDRYDLSGHSKVVTGKVGGGKTYSTKMAMYRRLLNDNDVRLIIFDPLGDDFVDFAEKAGGSVIKFGGNDRINPLQIEPPQGDTEETEAYSNNVRSVIEILKTYFEQSQRAGMTAGEEGVIGHGVHYAYAKMGITSDPQTFHNDSPILDDVIEGVNIISKGGIHSNKVDLTEDLEDETGSMEDCHPRTKEVITNPSDEHVKIAQQLVPKFESFKAGSVNNNLNGRTNIDLQHRIVCFNMEAFADTGEMPLIMHTMLDWAYQEARRRPEKFDVTFEEAHYLLGRPGSRKLLNLFIRHARHFGAGLTLISQTPDEFLGDGNDEKKEIYDNCDIKQLFYQENVSQEVIDYYDFSDEEARFLRQAARGQNSDFSECLLSTSEHGRRRLEIYVDPYERHVIEEGLDPRGYLEQLGYDLDEGNETPDSELTETMAETARQTAIPDNSPEIDTSPEPSQSESAEGVLSTSSADTIEKHPAIEEDTEDSSKNVQDPYKVGGKVTDSNEVVEENQNNESFTTSSIDQDLLDEVSSTSTDTETDKEPTSRRTSTEESNRQNKPTGSTESESSSDQHQPNEVIDTDHTERPDQIDKTEPAEQVESQITPPENEEKPSKSEEATTDKDDSSETDQSKLAVYKQTIKNILKHIWESKTFWWAIKIIPITLLVIALGTVLIFAPDLIP